MADQVSAPTGSSQPVGLDRATLHGLLQLGMWGFWIYGFGPSVPILRDELGISSAIAGLHSTASALGSIIAGIWGVSFVNQVGRGRARHLGALTLGFGVLLYVLAPSLAVSLPAVLIAGTGGAMIINTLNVSLIRHHRERGSAWLTSAHATGSTLGILAPVFIGLAISSGLGWRIALTLPPLVLVLAYVTLRGHDFDGDAHDPLPSTEQTPGPSAHTRQPMGARFWWIFAGLLSITVVEFSSLLWATDLLRTQHGFDRATAPLGFSVMLAGMAISRWISIPIVSRTGPRQPMAFSLVMTLTGAVVTLVTTVPVGGLIGMAVMGFGLGPLYPLIMGRAIAAASHHADRAANIASVGLGAIAGLAPFALGAAADVVGITAAFVAVPVAVVASGLCLAMARRYRS